MLPETSTAPEQNPMETANAGETPTERAARPRARRAPPTQRSDYVLTIDARDRIQTEEEREEIIWHEIRNAYRTRRVLTGIWGGVEQTQSGRTLAIVDYKPSHSQERSRATIAHSTPNASTRIIFSATAITRAWTTRPS